MTYRRCRVYYVTRYPTVIILLISSAAILADRPADTADNESDNNRKLKDSNMPGPRGGW